MDSTGDLAVEHVAEKLKLKGILRVSCWSKYINADLSITSSFIREIDTHMTYHPR
jgi:hypothetical protein